MWLGKKLRELKSKVSSNGNAVIRNNQYFQRIDDLLKEPTIIVDFNTLNWMTKTTAVSPEECTILTDVLMFKLNGYRQTNRRGRKMFKTLVIIDYLILNGVSAFIDLFEEHLALFAKVAGCERVYLDADAQFEELIVRKAVHISSILCDKQLRMHQKEHLQRARMLMIRNGKENLLNSQEQVVEVQQKVSIEEPKSRFQRMESFLSNGLEKLAIALIGLIDEQAVLYANSEGNKDFMENGESIIENEPAEGRSQAKHTSEKADEKKHTEQLKDSNQQPPPTAPVPKSPQLENLLGLQLELI